MSNRHGGLYLFAGMKLSQFANRIGISYSTALRMFRRNEIPGAYKLPAGTIVVPEGAIALLKGEKTGDVDVESMSAVLSVIQDAARMALGEHDADNLMTAIHDILMQYYSNEV